MKNTYLTLALLWIDLAECALIARNEIAFRKCLRSLNRCLDKAKKAGINPNLKGNC